MADDEFFMLQGVRVSYPHFFKRPIINGEEGKCGAVFLLDRQEHAVVANKIKNAIDDLIQSKLKLKRLPSDKVCLRDGDESGKPEYEGYLILSANSKGKPVVLGGDGRTVITREEDSRIYAGCYVNAKISLWAQNNNHGKRVNGSLAAVQFAGDGEPLDGSYVSVEDAMSGFDAVNDDGAGEDDAFLAA